MALRALAALQMCYYQWRRHTRCVRCVYAPPLRKYVIFWCDLSIFKKNSFNHGLTPKLFLTGSLLCTPLGELTTLPLPPSGLGKGTPLTWFPILHPPRRLLHLDLGFASYLYPRHTFLATPPHVTHPLSKNSGYATGYYYVRPLYLAFEHYTSVTQYHTDDRRLDWR